MRVVMAVAALVLRRRRRRRRQLRLAQHTWLLTFMQAKRQLAINILAHNSNKVLVGRGNVAYEAQARQHVLLSCDSKKALMTFQIMRAPWKLMETLQMTDKEFLYLGKWFEVSCRGLGPKKRVSWVVSRGAACSCCSTTSPTKKRCASWKVGQKFMFQTLHWMQLVDEA